MLSYAYVLSDIDLMGLSNRGDVGVALALLSVQTAPAGRLAPIEIVGRLGALARGADPRS